MDHETKEMFELLLSEIKGTRADVAELKVEIDDVKVRLTNVEDRLTNVEIDLAETKEMHVETLRLCKALMQAMSSCRHSRMLCSRISAQLQGRQKQYDAAILMLQ